MKLIDIAQKLSPDQACEFFIGLNRLEGKNDPNVVEAYIRGFAAGFRHGEINANTEAITQTILMLDAAKENKGT